MFGGGSGSFDSDTLLTNYDFILSDSNGDALNWMLQVDVNSSTASISGVAASGDEVTGGITMSGLNGQALSGWDAFLRVDFLGGFNFGDTITVNIPGGASVDIGALSTPEPGSGALMALAGAALAGVAAIRRRLS